MINANELRLGNIVSYKGVIGKVTWIQQDCITIEYQRQDDLSNGSMVSPELLDRVRLNDNIITEFGFKLQKSISSIGWDKFKNGNVELSLAPLKNGGYVFVYYIGGEYLYIRYIHQLQNLFFALSQKELDTTKLFD